METHDTDLLARIEQIAQDIKSPAGPNFGLFRYDTAAFRDELIDALVRELLDFQHIVLELAPTQVDDIESILREKMPPEILESPDVKWVLHIINLELSLYHEIWTGENALLTSLDRAVEVLENEFPFVSLIYADRYFHQEIEAKATIFREKAPIHEDFATEEGNEQVAEQALQLKQRFDEAVEQNQTGSFTGLISSFAKLIFQAGRMDWASELATEALTHQEVAERPNDKAQALLVKGLCDILSEEEDELEEVELTEEGEEIEEIQDGFEMIDEAIQIYRSANDQAALSESYYSLGGFYADLAYDFPRAERYFEAALRAATQAEDATHHLLAHRRLAFLKKQAGDLGAAAQHYAQAASAYQKQGKAVEAAKAYQQQAATLQDQHKWEAAKNAYQAGLAQAQQTEDEFLQEALADSVQEMDKRASKKASKKTKKRRGFFGL